MNNLFKNLGLNKDNGLFIVSERNSWQNLFPKRIEEFFDAENHPDAFFVIADKPFILFYENPKDKKAIFRRVWNFNESPIIFIIEPDNIEIYNGFKYLKNNTLSQIDNKNQNDFAYFKLVTGETWEKYQSDLDFKNRVDYNLLENIKAVRNILVSTVDKLAFSRIAGITKEDSAKIREQLKAKGILNKKYRVNRDTDFHNKSLDLGLELKFNAYKNEIIAIIPHDCRLNDSLANRLIGKCIFTRYLIDRKVIINYNNNSQVLTNDDFVKILQDRIETKNLFTYLQIKFNGDLFLIEDSEYQCIGTDSLKVLENLISGTEIETGQRSLFDLYDFSIIPVEFISNVYEVFIGKDEQAEQGAYYTPVFLVDYILSQTVAKYFKDNPEEYNCKILDPACGSGVFLVEAFRKIIKQYENLHPEVKKNSDEYKNTLKELAQNNLFGIDEDDKAISVAAFSIYLTMLHYQTPADIEIFEFPKLTETNFLEGDFFNEKFNNDKNLKDFNFIIGNPPWKRGSGEEKNPLYLRYIDKRKEEEKSECEISNKEISQAFLLRTSDFSNQNTKCALIVTSKNLYNLNAKDFRQYFLDNYFIDKVFEFAPVRREVFDKSNDPATTPAVILFYKYAQNSNTGENIIEHIALKPSRFFSMFKVFTIQRNDYKQIMQQKLKDDDYLWKILVYGSYLDFNLIKRLKDKDNYKSIADVIDYDDDFLVKQGLKRKDGNKKIDVRELIGWDFLDISIKGAIEQYYISSDKLKKWKMEEVGYIYRENKIVKKDVFSPPMLLIKESVTPQLRSVCVVPEKKILFTDKVTSIKAKDITEQSSYRIIASLLSSSFFSYYVVITGSTTGIMIEQQIHDIEKFSFPFINNPQIPKMVIEIEKLKKSRYEDNNILRYNEIDDKINNSINKLDKEVLKSFSLSEEEMAVVDYGVNITIPMIMKHKGYEKKVLTSIKSNDPILKEYRQVFFDRFDETFEKMGLDFTVEIWWNNNVIGMFFKEIAKSDKMISKIRILENENINDMLFQISSLGVNKISDKLFIQKDIRGFEEDGFYIIKPNEKRLWHKAIAYLDMYEFADAILKAGREDVNA